MIDIPLIPPSLAGNVSAHDPGGQGLVLKIPQGLEHLVKGALVDALVIRQNEATYPLLKFTSPTLQNTELPVATKLPLKDGAEVQLRILTNTLPGSAEAQAATRAGQPTVQPQFQAQVMSVDGKPLPPSMQAGFDTVRAVLPPLPSTTPPTTTAASNSGEAVINLSGGGQIIATVLKPEANAGFYLPRSAGQMGAAPALQASDSLKLQVVSTSLPSTVKPETTAPQPTTTPLPSQVSAYTKLGTPEAATLQQSLQSFAARPHAAPTFPSINNVTPTANTPSFTGIVLGTEKSGEAVLQTPLGLIRLPTSSARLPQGTIITLEVISVLAAAQKSIATPEVASPRTPALFIAQGFGELAALLKTPELTYIPPQQVLPHTADKQFAARLLWFIAGAAQGSAIQWLGEPARRALEDAGHKPLLQKLDSVFQSLKAAFSEPTPQGWVSLPFPVWDGEKLQHGMFHLHRDPDAEKEERRKKDARFMIEVTLEDTGELQIDGLVQQAVGSQTLDLVIRTHAPLPDTMRSGIIQVFEDTNTITGIRGSLQFQAMRDFPVHPLEHDDQGIIV